MELPPDLNSVAPRRNVGQIEDMVQQLLNDQRELKTKISN